MKLHHPHTPIVLAAFALTTAQAWAQDATAPVESAAAEPVVAAPAADAPAGVVISGFVDTSFSFTSVNSSKPTSVGFGIDQVEIDISKAWDKVALRADIEGGADYSTGTGVGVYFNIEQGFLDYKPMDTLTLTFGRFLAPIGWELLDAPDMYQYSHADVFMYGVPFALTGAMVSFDPDGLFDGKLYVANGFDDWYEINNGKAVGTRLGFTFGDHNVGLSGLYNYGDVFIADVDATLAFSGAKVGLEGNYGIYENATSEKWYGGLAMVNFGMTEKTAMTFRADTFKDTSTGLRKGVADELYVRGTVSPSVVLADGAGALIEYTATYMDIASAVDHLVALEVTYKF